MAPTLQPETDEARQQFVTETSSVAGYTDSTPRAEKPDKDLQHQSYLVSGSSQLKENWSEVTLLSSTKADEMPQPKSRQTGVVPARLLPAISHHSSHRLKQGVQSQSLIVALFLQGARCLLFCKTHVADLLDFFII